MAIPASAIPSGNAYTVHVAHPVAPSVSTSEASGAARDPLAVFAATSALLLRRWKVPVRLHASGDSARLTLLREFLAGAGAKPSGFSPSPSAAIPGEGFWKTTVVVAQAVPGISGKAGAEAEAANFWAAPSTARQDKKVEWDPLLAALAVRCSPADFPPSVVAAPDLWCVWQGDAGAETPAENLAAAWIRAGAAAVCVMTPDGGSHSYAWRSDSAVFGKSSGKISGGPREDSAAPSNGSVDDAETSSGVFAAGIVTGIVQELLEENLFEKTLVRADRQCLEIRPLRLGRACLQGIAALKAAEGIAAVQASPEAPRAGNPRDIFQKNGGLAERAQRHLARLRGPESKPWGSKGR